MTASSSKALQIVVVTTLLHAEGDDAELQQRLMQRSASLRIALLQAGYQILAVLPGDVYLIERLQQLQADLIIIDAESDARDVLEDLVIASRNAPRPMVLFTDEENQQQMQAALRAGVSAYVVAGMQKERIKPVLEVALARFNLEQQMREELAQTKLKLSERKLIEKAKGILMTKHGLSEEQAYQRLRRQAMDKNLKMVELAQRLLDAADLLA